MINQTDIRNIIENYSDNTISLYLRVDPSYIENQAQTPAWNIHLKNALNEIEKSLDPSQHNACKDITQRLDNHFNVYQPGGRTLVIFMDEKREFIRELPFTLNIQSHFGKPMIAPLLWAIDEYEHYMIIMVDQQKALFRKAYMGNLEAETEMTIDLEYDWGEKTMMPATNGDGQALRQGTNRDAFDDMIEAHRDRFYQDVADEIRMVFKKDNPIRLILAGDERSAHELQNKLHQSVADNLVSILAIPMDANDRTITEHIWQTAYNYERNFEFDLINNIIEMAHPKGLGTVGRISVAKAISMQQVEMIIMPYILLSDDPDYAQQITIWALENNVKLEFVHGQAAQKLQNAGDIAAKLYYSLETA